MFENLDILTLVALIVYMILSVIAVGFTIFKIIKWFEVRQLVKRGYYRVRYIPENFRAIVTYARPEQKIIKLNIGKSSPEVFPFSDDYGYVHFDGSVPEISFNSEKGQLKYQKKPGEKGDDNLTFDPKQIGQLVVRTWNEGKLAGAAKEALLLILVALTLIAVLGSVYFTIQNFGSTQAKLDTVQVSVDTLVNQTKILLATKAQNVTTIAV